MFPKKKKKTARLFKIIFTFIMKLFIILLILSTEFSLVFKPQKVWAENPLSSTSILETINKERNKNNLLPLIKNNKLIQAANNKARYLLKNNLFDHNSADGTKIFSDWIKESNYEYSFVGENLAINFSDEKSILKAWMDSPSHRENILDENYLETGIAVQSKNGKILVVQIFGRPANRPLNLKNDLVDRLSENLIYFSSEKWKIQNNNSLV